MAWYFIILMAEKSFLVSNEHLSCSLNEQSILNSSSKHKPLPAPWMLGLELHSEWSGMVDSLLSLLKVTGLDGNYRITCHTVMEVLREHKDSVMAVLEAFVYDPLLNWRLMDSKWFLLLLHTRNPEAWNPVCVWRQSDEIVALEMLFLCAHGFRDCNVKLPQWLKPFCT